MSEAITDLNGNYSIKIKPERLPVACKIECNNNVKDSAYGWSLEYHLTMEYRTLALSTTSSVKQIENFILINIKPLEEKNCLTFSMKIKPLNQ